MNSDSRRLALTEPTASDERAFELLSAWVEGDGKILVMTATATGLDRTPEVWGQVLAGIANNIALSAEKHSAADRPAMLAQIKQSLDRHWSP